MTKPGLGRGLDRLMNGDEVAGRAAGNDKVAARQEPAPVPQAGRGLNTLLAAGPAADEAKPKTLSRSITKAAPAPLPAAAPKVLLPAWFFFCADILLLAYCVAICFDAPKPLDAGHVVFCAVSVALGAILGIAGVLRSGD